MQDILTASDIRTYREKGVRIIELPAQPVMTDVAREELARFGMEIRVGGGGQAPAGPQEADRPKTAGTFRDLLAQKTNIVGTFVQTPHPVMTEFLGKLGFDFVTIDSEHNAMHLETVQKLLQGLNGAPTFGMVRIPTISYDAIAGALDIGADALLIPQIRTMEDVQRIKDCALYPPRGKRGIGPSRATGFGLDIMDKAEQPDRNTSIVVQIETTEAVKNLDAILAEDFFDMVFIGPGDLSMDMGIFGQFSNPRLTENILHILEKAKGAGKRAGIFAGNFEVASAWFAKGFDMVIVNSELALLAQALTTGLNACAR